MGTACAVHEQPEARLASTEERRRQRHAKARAEHWDGVARDVRHRGRTGRYYHQRLAEIYRHLVAPHLRVLELGCGDGDLLAALKPAIGVGVDFSEEMLREACARHPELTFVNQNVDELQVGGTFDVVILSDLVNDLWDVQGVLKRIRPLCTPTTRVLLNSYSRLWELPLAAAARLGLARPTLRQNWLTVEDMENLLRLTGFEPLRRSQEILWPFWTPVLAWFSNAVLVKLWPLRHLALANVFVARLEPAPRYNPPPLVSVIVPARNEAGNIADIFTRTPEMGAGTEIIFVEGHSHDDTYAVVERAIAEHPERRCKLLRQVGIGKGDAVRAGFEAASGDVLMILDADLTVPPEVLPRFYEALVSGRGEFINGVRLVYPMDERAMRFLNLLANRFFSITFSWLLGQPIKDTLCGTKVLSRRDYRRIAANRAYLGDFDPFGDFDLIFGAARQNLKLADLPIRYRERTYGTTNIQRFRHGLLLLRMVIFAALRIKFV
jgi:2-polyprenyl-3-methyl-5-hydroxy-6-metoxy-1,4-benzoquinol methylase